MTQMLSHRVAVVTGGGRGIGRATAIALARDGLHVAIGDLDAAAAEAVASEIGDRAIGAALDVCDPASFGALLAEAERTFGPADVLVNNAGVMRIGPFDEEDADAARRMVDINVHGVLTGMRLVLPGMKARGRGHIVNLASSAARIAVPGGATYTGTKAFVLAASESVRAELHGSGVQISCICPGVVNTELTAGLHRPSYVKEVQPEDVAGAIVATLHKPRFEVWVPRAMGRQQKANALMPIRARQALARLAKADRFLLERDDAARAAYENRAARS